MAMICYIRSPRPYLSSLDTKIIREGVDQDYYSAQTPERDIKRKVQ